MTPRIEKKDDPDRHNEYNEVADNKATEVSGMGQGDYTTRKQKWEQVSEKERYEIEALRKAKWSIAKIAEQLGRSRRTIQRELRRGEVVQRDTLLAERLVYLADAGQRVHEERAANKGRGVKIGHNHALARYLEEKIVGEGYSPDAALGLLKQTEQSEIATICTKTVYNYIDKGLFAGITNADLPVKRDKKRKKRRRIRKVALNNTKGRSIEERPILIERREEEGHWEMDCVVGKPGTTACLLVMTERKHATELIFKMKDRTQESVQAVLNGLERRFKDRFSEIFKTITVDNGGEFLSSERLERSIRADGKQRTTIYYAHPYSVWERGSNENQNKLIRRFVPKGTDIGKLSKRAVARIQYWMNHYPRRRFAFETPAARCTLGVLVS